MFMVKKFIRYSISSSMGLIGLATLPHLTGVGVNTRVAIPYVVMVNHIIQV